MIETLLTFFGVGALGFWLLLCLASTIFIAGVESDRYALSVIATIALGAIYWKPLLALGSNWKLILIFAVLYVIIGTAWSIWRWSKFVQKTVDDYKSKHPQKLSEIDESVISSRIDVTYHKTKITGWIAYWPWSAFWNLTEDFFTMIYDNIKAIYQKISDKAMEKLKSP